MSFALVKRTGGICPVLPGELRRFRSSGRVAVGLRRASDDHRRPSALLTREPGPAPDHLVRGRRRRGSSSPVRCWTTGSRRPPTCWSRSSTWNRAPACCWTCRPTGARSCGQLAVWRAGACVVLAGGSGRRRRRDRRARLARGLARQLVAVSLPALARRFVGDLPPGALDAAASVMTYGDVDRLGADPRAERRRPRPRPDPRRARRVGARRAARGRRAGARRRRPGSHLDTRRPTHLVGILARNGSVVLVDDALASALDADPDRAARLVASERITVS